MTKTCDRCEQVIPPGAEVTRSRNFRLLTWHRECYAEQRIPTQRTGDHDAD